MEVGRGERSPSATPLPRWPAVVLVTDRERLRGRALDDVVRTAVEGGVSIVQLRDQTASHEELVREGRAVRAAITGRALFFVNSDVEAAIALGADGVHLPEAGATIAQVRARAGASILISRAVHGVAAAVAAEREGADIVQAGTLFDTASKAGARALGVAGLRAICAEVRVPVIAIGGITAANAGEATAAGAAGVAVIGAIFGAEDAREAAAALVAGTGGQRSEAGAVHR